MSGDIEEIAKETTHKLLIPLNDPHNLAVTVVCPKCKSTVHAECKCFGNESPTTSEQPNEETGLLPCPFCGWPCDECENEDGEGYYGCDNPKCPARKLAMTREQWNQRSSVASLQEEVEQLRAALKLAYPLVRSTRIREVIDAALKGDSK